MPSVSSIPGPNLVDPQAKYLKVETPPSAFQDEQILNEVPHPDPVVQRASSSSPARRKHNPQELQPCGLAWEVDQRILDNPAPRTVWDKEYPSLGGIKLPEGVRLIELLPKDANYQFVEQYFQKSQQASAQQGLEGLSQFQIRKIQLIDNPEYEDLFLGGAHTLIQRQGNEAFKPESFDDSAEGQLRKKVLKLFEEKIKDYSPPDRTCQFLPLWHGTRKEVLPSILGTGFADLAKTDVGYYGKGIYGSTSAEYVKRVYSQGYHKGVLLLNWAVVYSPYPVAVKKDIDVLKGKGKRGNYDAHYIPVKPRNPFTHKMGKEGTYFPLDTLQDQPCYDELAVFNERHVLARYLVEIERVIPTSLHTAKEYFEFARSLADDEKVLLPGKQEQDTKETLFKKSLELRQSKAEDGNLLSEIKDELGALILRKEEATVADLKRAQTFFEEAISPQRDSRTFLASPYFHLAQVLQRLKIPTLQLEERVGSLRPQKTEDFNKKEYSLEELASKAVELDEQLHKKKPEYEQHPEYYLFLASLKSREPGKPLEQQEAFGWIQKALQLNPGLSQAYDLLGKLLYAHEQVLVQTHLGQERLTAPELFKRAIALDEDYYPGYVHLGEHLWRNKKGDFKVELEFPVDQKLTARGLFEYAIEKNPTLPLAYARLAQCLSYQEIVDLNQWKTRAFLENRLEGELKKQYSKNQSMGAQDIGQLAYDLDSENPITSTALASTLKGEEKKKLKNGVTTTARELCKNAYLIANGEQLRGLEQPAVISEVYLALAKTLEPGEKIQLTEISSSTGSQPEPLGQEDLWKKALEYQSDCKKAVLLLSQRVTDSASTSSKDSLAEVREKLLSLLKYYPADALILDQLGMSLKDQVSTVKIDGTSYDSKKLFEWAFKKDPTNSEIYGHLTSLGEVSVESWINSLKGQSEQEVKADLAMVQGFDLYVPVKATVVDQSEKNEPEDKDTVDLEKEEKDPFDLKKDPFDLEKRVNHFLQEGEHPLLLLQGKAGSSKSLFGRRLERKLWEEYERKSEQGNNQEALIPLFISLPQIANPKEKLVEQALARKGVQDSKTIEALKAKEFVFILDGLDEVGKKILEPSEEGGKKSSFLIRNQFNTAGGWQGKILVSSRFGYLTSADTLLLTPSLDAKEASQVLRYFIVPFSPERIKDYIQHYARPGSSYNTAGWTAEKYQEVLDSFQGQGLEALMKEPFLLQLILRVLPELKGKLETTQHSKLTRYQLYEYFMQGWFQKEVERLKRANQLPPFLEQDEQKGLTIEEKDLKRKERALKIMDEYATDLGFELFLKEEQMIDLDSGESPQIPTPVIKGRIVDRSNTKMDYENKEVKEGKKGWMRFFESSNKIERQQLEIGFKGSPLKQVSEGKYMFLHKSFQEYFAARKVLQEILQPFKTQEEFLQFAKDRWGELALNRKDLSSDPSVLSFIEDHFSITQFPTTAASLPGESSLDFQSRLWKMIEASQAHKESRDFAGGNAATLFNRARIGFSGKDLKGVNLSGANLSGAIFDGTNLEKAILRGVDFKGAWLRGAHLKESDMSNVQFEFGELASHCFSGNVSFCTHSADRKLFAVAEGKTIHLFTVKVGENPFQLRESLRGYTGFVRSMTFSSDGKYLASGSQDKTIHLWKLGEKEGEPQRIEGHTGEVKSVVFSADSQFLASASSDKTIRLWKISEGKAEFVQQLQGHTGAVTSVAFSPKASYLASGSEDKTVHLWKIGEAKAELVQQLQGHDGPIHSVTFSPDGQILASAGGIRDKTTVRLWKLEEEKAELFQTLDQGHTSSITHITFSPDGQVLASAGGYDKTVRLWKLENGKAEPLQTLEGHVGFVTSVSFRDNQNLVSSGGYDHSVRLWNFQEGKTMRAQNVEGHTGIVTSVAWSPDGHVLASGSEDQTVRLWKLEGEKAELSQTLKSQDASTVNSVTFSRDGKSLASATKDWYKNVHLWKLSGGKAEFSQTLEGYTDLVQSVAFSPKGQYLASGSADQTVRLWELEGGKAKPLQVLGGHTGSIQSVTFSWDGHYLASGSEDQTVRLWELEGGKAKPLQVLGGHTGSIQSVAFSPKGQYLASGSADQTVRLWNLERGKAGLLAPLNGHKGSVQSVAFSPKGSFLASGGDDSSIWIWELSAKDFKNLFTTQTPFKVYSLAYSPASDRLFLATAGDDCSVRLWEQTAERLTLLWSSCQTLLWVEKADITQSKLSSQNMTLLTQRGALREQEKEQEASAAQLGMPKASLSTIIPFVYKEWEDHRVPSSFAALGEMHEALGLLWSAVAPGTMSQYDAQKFCQGLGEDVRLPTAEEWEALGKIMSPEERFNPDLFPGTRDKAFWSSSIAPGDSGSAFYFDGNADSISSGGRSDNRSARCVIEATESKPKPTSLGTFVSIPGGKFLMGSPATEANRRDEEKQHEVELSPFEMGESVVTQEVYAMFTGSNPSYHKERKHCPQTFKIMEINGKDVPMCPDHAVESVSWYDAQAFIRLVNQALQGQGYTYALPTEAQTEYAMRGGTTTAYVSGEDDTELEKYVIYNVNSKSQTQPVKSKSSNSFGIYRGGVWEWTMDWYSDKYEGSEGLDPKGPSSGSGRVFRGGSWDSSAQDCRSAFRDVCGPLYRFDFVGFRLCRRNT